MKAQMKIINFVSIKNEVVLYFPKSMLFFFLAPPLASRLHAIALLPRGPRE